ncbi:MAG: hypothetical protein HY736_00180 [Verrucomicrobia bacterium]|nr:hypothetical protein [Verrucomicrobiota bacterium]
MYSVCSVGNDLTGIGSNYAELRRQTTRLVASVRELTQVGECLDSACPAPPPILHGRAEFTRRGFPGPARNAQ